MHKERDLLERFPTLMKLALRRARRRIPVVRQLTATDCGAAALTMVLGYWGKRVRLDEVRARIGIGRSGATMASLLRAARAYGLRGRGVAADVPDLKDLPAGAILHWEFRHFVVLEKCERNSVRIVDPAH